MKTGLESIAQFIEMLKGNADIIGILEYGGRSCDDMTKGGDYDLTIITRSPISRNISGLHFRIAGIPVDCMIKSVDDFMSDEPASVFELAHLCAEYIAREIGGLWRDDEVIFHLNADTVSHAEKDDVLDFIFAGHGGDTNGH